MRRTALTIIGMGLLAAGCGLNDPSPERVRRSVSIRAGGEKEATVRSEDSYRVEEWSWESDVKDLPPGFEYDTEDVFFDGDDRLRVSFELRVRNHVPVGVYRFSVTYEIVDYDSVFAEEVTFKLTVRVKPGGRHLAVMLALPPEHREGDVSIELP